MRTATIASLVVLLLAAAVAGAQVAIDVGAVDLAPGSVAALEVTLRSSRPDIGGTANTITVDAPLSVSDCKVNSAIDRPASIFGLFPSGCEEAGECRSVRAIILFFAAIVAPLEDGDVLYTCDVSAVAAAPPGDYPISCSAAEAGTVDAAEVDIACVDGVARVRAAPPTAMASATPTATQTEILVATATVPPPICPADCNSDGMVSIEELVLAVRIALRAVELTNCLAASNDGEAVVSIAELVQAVRAALDGC